MALKTGPICGDPLRGLCERVCLRANKIIDGCTARFENIAVTTELTNFSGGTESPLTFIEARTSGASIVGTTSITPLEGGRYRIVVTVTTPIIVAFTDSTGTPGSASGTFTITRDVVLRLPPESISGYSIEALTAFSSTIGNITSAGATLTACVVQVLRVVVPVDIMLPSYGYPEYPECQNYADLTCRGLFSLPIFPSV